MASTISESLELTLQDDDDFISILKTAENFEKIDNRGLNNAYFRSRKGWHCEISRILRRL